MEVLVDGVAEGHYVSMNIKDAFGIHAHTLDHMEICRSCSQAFASKSAHRAVLIDPGSG